MGKLQATPGGVIPGRRPDHHDPQEKVTMANANSTTRRIPKLRLHKPSGLAVCTLAGKDRYLGKFGSVESRVAYERIITAWLGNPDVPPPTPEPDPGELTCVELAAMYLKHAAEYYTKNGRTTSEFGNIRRTIKGLREHFGSLAVREFSPLKLREVRDGFVKAGLARTNANRFTRIIVRIFSWGVEHELCPPSVVHGLREVKALAKGRCQARETAPVRPIDEATLEATIEHAPAMIAAMIKFQSLVACRPGELVAMRPSDIDMTGDVWIYRVEGSVNKTEHRGKSRIVMIGPQAQLLLKPWLPPFDGQFIWRSQRGSHYTPSGYATAIHDAALRAGVKPWAPNQLRHYGATQIRKQASLDAAQVLLGHSHASTTEIYAERNLEAAAAIARRIG
jgi:integrase